MKGMNLQEQKKCGILVTAIGLVMFAIGFLLLARLPAPRATVPARFMPGACLSSSFFTLCSMKSQKGRSRYASTAPYRKGFRISTTRVITLLNSPNR